MEASKIYYGVWIPKAGWLKVDSEPLAFELKEVAESTAQRIGDHASVEFIDDSLAGLENQLLDAERKQLEEAEEQAKKEAAEREALVIKQKQIGKLRRFKNFLAGDGSV